MHYVNHRNFYYKLIRGPWSNIKTIFVYVIHLEKCTATEFLLDVLWLQPSYKTQIVKVCLLKKCGGKFNPTHLIDPSLLLKQSIHFCRHFKAKNNSENNFLFFFWFQKCLIHVFETMVCVISLSQEEKSVYGIDFF